MALDTLQNGLVSISSSLGNTIKSNPIKTAAIVGGTGAIIGGTALVVAKSRSSRAKRSKRSWKLDRARRSKQKWEVAYQKRKRKKKAAAKKRGGKKIYYAKKTGQPYILKANGQAKFIKGKRRKR